MRVAMLTGGGDCPGLNAVMRAVARKGEGIAARLAASVRTVQRMGPDDPAMKDKENPDAAPGE